jgi:hypothetical protein
MDLPQVLDIYNYYMLQTTPDGYKSPQKVGWANKFDQEIRFKILLDIGVKPGDSLLDWGCGLGHLIDYMKTNNIEGVVYNGIDINTFIINIAKNSFPEHNFDTATIGDVTNNYDWIIASGIFSFGVDIDDIVNDVSKAYSIANKGVAFNCLLPLQPFIESGFSVYDPKEVLDVLSDIYPNVYLIEGYTNDDFTIYITKEPMYETK